jgi:GAF domain-containing protein
MNTPLRPGPQGAARKAAFERRIVHVADLLAEPGFSPMDGFATSVQQLEQARTVLAVPLLRQMELVGVIALWRREVRPFTEKQVALLRTLSLRGSLKMAA